MGLLNHFTRGGQLSLHKYRMIQQVLGITFVLCLLTGLLSFGGLMFKHTSAYDRYLCFQYALADLKVTFSFADAFTATQDFTYRNGRTREVRSQDILTNRVIKTTLGRVTETAKKQGRMAAWYILMVLFLLVLLFGYMGHTKTRKKLDRGGKIVDVKKLTKLIKKRKLASDLNLDGLPLIKDKETSHILVTGTTGAGKSNCLHTLLPQIRARGDRAIIVDLTGELETRYLSSSDLLLNPLDNRTQPWLPWFDCPQEPHYDQLAAAVVPPTGSHEVFWENAAKALLSTALKKTKDKKDVQKLYELLVQENLTQFSNFFKKTDAAAYTHVDGEKMTLSIRATLANQIQWLKLLKNTKEPFSIRQWVADATDKNWLFLTARPDQRETLRPLLSAWFEIAINGLMSTIPDPNRRLWFIIDELPSLQKLPSLGIAMAESRKYGGCVLAGVQSFPQLNALYGVNKAQSLLDLFNTKIFFRNTDPNTNQWISRVLGEAETTEHIENLSYGANTIRDGISLSQQTKTKPLVLPTEITALEDLEAFVKLPGNLPVGRVRLVYKNLNYLKM